jgi:hypothetical protein
MKAPGLLRNIIKCSMQILHRKMMSYPTAPLKAVAQQRIHTQ